MIFITKVHLKNFQAHKNTELEFHRGLNVIIGHSDSGKTAIIRAIKWAIYNEPLGDYFLRQGENEVAVTLTFNTGAVIKRYRKGSKNAYYLKKSDGEEYNFDGFGTKVPKEISDEIKMYKINLDEKSSTIINISEQLEGPFLLNEKGSVRASAIGRLVGVNYIDDALRETIRDAKQININLKNRVSEKEALEDTIKEFDYLDSLDENLKKLKNIKNQIDFKRNKIEVLKLLLNKYNTSEKDIKNNKIILKKYQYIDLFQEKIANISNILVKLQTIDKLNKLYIKTNDEVIYNESLVFKLKNIGKVDKISSILTNKIHNYKNLKILKSEAIKNYKDIELNVNIQNKYSNLNTINNIYDKLFNYINKFNIIYDLYKKFDFVQKSINTGEDFYNRFAKLNECKIITKNIEDELTLLNKLLSSYSLYLQLSKKITKEEDGYESFSIKIEYYINKYNEYLKKIGYCPVCLSKIDKETINHIEEYFKE